MTLDAASRTLSLPSPLVGEGGEDQRSEPGEGFIWAQEDPSPGSSLRSEPPSPTRGEDFAASFGLPDATITIAGVTLAADPAGTLYWCEERMLIVADLHLEKGSAFALRGAMLPPYDTGETLSRLAPVIARYEPARVIALGDSFHDRGGSARLFPRDRDTLRALQRGRDWIWIAGNHDPEPHASLDGACAHEVACGPLTFRHEPTGHAADGEIAGHLHPKAQISQRGRVVKRRCFASDGKRMVMPAFGAYAGGLNIRDKAFLRVFGALGFMAHMLGERRIYGFAAARCLA